MQTLQNSDQSKMELWGRQFRTALSSFPTGVTVVTAVDPEGHGVGVTVNSFVSISLTPPLVMWSLASKAKCRASFESATGFTVNVLAHDQQTVAHQFSRAVEDRFSEIEHRRLAEGGIALGGVSSWFDCRTDRVIEAGDHLLFIGHVIEFELSESDPLVFWRSRFVEAGLNSR